MKYDRLRNYLLSSRLERITLSFAEIESVLSFSLPNSARQYQAWWANGSHLHADAWLNAGYKVEQVNFLRQLVVFVKDGTAKKAVKSESEDAAMVRHTASRTRKTGTSVRSTSVSDDILHRTTNDMITVCGYSFSFIQELIPECDVDGRIKEYRPQANYHKDKPLNAYGDGSFCRFSIHAGNWPGVYLWVTDGEIIYIGETEALARRFNTGYGVIAPVNCYIGGQTTNCRMNKVVLEQARQGKYVKLYFYQTEEYKKTELKLLRTIRTKYNVKDNDPVHT